VRNTYDGLGRVVEQRDGAGGRWRYRYEPAATVVTDPLGHTKRFRFDERYRTLAITEANGATTRFWWDDASNLVAVEDPTGRTSRLAYNSRGDLTSAEGPASAPVHFEWDTQGHLTAVVSAEGERAEFTWDGASRPVRLVSPAGVTTTVTWWDDGLPESISDGDGGTTRYTFDAAGRLTSIIDPVGAVTTASFDAAGRPVAEAHPGGERMTFTWDHCDRLVTVTDEAGATHRYLYDRCDRLTAITDPLGRVTRYAYGPLGLLASVTDPLGRETTFTYDACGRLATRTDARGAIASFSYDPAGRLVGIDGPGIVPITYGWDDAGRLVALSDATGESTWELDEAGRPAVERRPQGIDLAHRYDTLGRRNRLELRRAEALVGAWEYGFDPDGRITSVLDPSGATTRLVYDPAGRLASLHHPNGVMTTWAYDAAGEPIGLAHAARDGTVLSSWTNAFDDDGNLVRSEHRQSGEPSGAVQIFDYDHLGRLTCVHDGVVPTSFFWDDASNQTGAGPTGTILATGYDDADQVTARDSFVYSHDQAGNFIHRTGGDEPPLAIAYDTLGRVVELRAGEEIVAFTYDGLGRRVGKTSKGMSTTRIFDSASVIAEVADKGLARLETTAGLLVLHRLGPSGGVYLHADANTNVSAVTDEAGNVIARFAYTPFGARTTTAGDADAAAPFGFCGTIGVREDLVGLLDMRARLYDPTLGRFTSPDPWPAYLPDPVTLNRYLYALGDPISQVDPLGLFCWMGSKHGKCKGLRDVATQGVDVVKRAADIAEEPLSLVSKVSAGVAVVAAGVTALCAVPCGVVAGPIAATAGNVSFYTGLGASLSHCIDSGVLTFDCAASAASSAISTASRSLFKTAVQSAGGVSEDLGRMINFGGKTFSLFRAGTGTAAGRVRK
jgi:RHS repeat-associated protein